MDIIRKLFILGISILIIIQSNLYCQSKTLTQIDIIFDASGSMWGQIDGQNKIVIARTVLKDLLSDFKEQKNTQLALRVYGHLNKQCDNSVLEIPMGFGNYSIIADKIEKINPLGKTPIAYSLLESINDFNQDQNGDKIIILVTDGIESCNGNACEVALELKNAGIITKMHVVGFGMKEEEIESLKCIAEPFNGKVIGASNANELKEAFNEISEEISIDKNVEIVGLDINNDQVYMDVDIFQADNKIDSSDGTVAKFFLKKGTYVIYAKSRDTDIVVKKKINLLEDGENLKIEIVFAEGKVKLNSVNSDNKSIYAFYTFYDDTQQEVLSTEGNGFIEKNIIPGTYDIQAYEQNTYSTLWAKDVQINPGETIEKIFSFAMGTIVITPLIPSGDISSEYWWYEFYNTETMEKQKVSAEGVGAKEVEILPGNYSIRVIDGYNSQVSAIDNIKIEAGTIKNIKITIE